MIVSYTVSKDEPESYWVLAFSWCPRWRKPQVIVPLYSNASPQTKTKRRLNESYVPTNQNAKRSHS